MLTRVRRRFKDYKKIATSEEKNCFVPQLAEHKLKGLATTVTAIRACVEARKITNKEDSFSHLVTQKVRPSESFQRRIHFVHGTIERIHIRPRALYSIQPHPEQAPLQRQQSVDSRKLLSSRGSNGLNSGNRCSSKIMMSMLSVMILPSSCTTGSSPDGTIFVNHAGLSP